MLPHPKDGALPFLPPRTFIFFLPLFFFFLDLLMLFPRALTLQSQPVSSGEFGSWARAQSKLSSASPSCSSMGRGNLCQANPASPSLCSVCLAQAVSICLPSEGPFPAPRSCQQQVEEGILRAIQDRTCRDLPGGLGLCHGFPLGWKLLGAGPALVGNS